MFMVPFVYFPAGYHHLYQQYWIDSIALTVDLIPILVSVILVLQLRFVFDVVVLNLRYQPELVLVSELQKGFVLIQKVDFVFQPTISQNDMRLGCSVKFVVVFQLISFLFQRCLVSLESLIFSVRFVLLRAFLRMQELSLKVNFVVYPSRLFRRYFGGTGSFWIHRFLKVFMKIFWRIHCRKLNW